MRGPLPGDLRLYGGTALALYLNHRASTDFDLVTPESVVDVPFVKRTPWFTGCTINGEPGMVDIRKTGRARELTITMMEAGMMVPLPSRSPILAENGVAVAHPFDLVVSKSRACLSRLAERDFIDLAEAILAWPETARQAWTSIEDQQLSRLAACVADSPHGVLPVLSPNRLEVLRNFANDFVRLDFGRSARHGMDGNHVGSGSL